MRLWPAILFSCGVELLFHNAASIFVVAATTTTTTAAEDGDNDPTTTTTKSSSSTAVRIAGYLPDYRIESVDLNATLALLDDVYLFSLSPQIQLGDNMFQACCLQPHHYELLEQAMMQTTKERTRPKVWITVGGAGRSHKLTKAPSSIMMRALTKLIFTDQKKLNITGIDWDCELFLDHGDYESYDQLVTAATHIFPPQGIAVSMALVRTCCASLPGSGVLCFATSHALLTHSLFHAPNRLHGYL
jgi:hypothetical protein